MADDILDGKEPQGVVAALLKHQFQDELDAKNYNEIRDVAAGGSLNRQGRTRLFVALGKSDGMSPRSLIDYIRETAEVAPNLIQDIRIFDEFSFLTVPFEDAELILGAFRKKSQGKRPVVDRAKEKR
jgi:ATP-dependent RNA helicase DeaD